MVFSVICVGIFGAYLIAGSSFGLSANANKNQKNITDSQPLLESQFGLVANSINDNDFSSYSQNESVSKIRPGNLTDLLAASAFKGIKNFDVSDSEAAKNFNINSPENRQILNDTIKSIDSLKIGGSLEEINLKTTPDNTKSSKIAYLKNLISIFSESVKDESLLLSSAQQVIDDINDDCFVKSGASLSAKRAELFKSISDQYLALKAPSQWIDFHKQLVGYYQSAYLIFQSFSDCANDPIKGYAMVERLTQLIQDTSVKKLFLEKCSEVKIDCSK